jgi:poly(A) polymerase
VTGVGERERPIDRALDSARPLAALFHGAGNSFFLVGGVVRDQFLDRDDADPDIDCTTDARPDQIHAVVDEIADATWPQGEEFGTVGCRIGPTVFEITTHRADAYEPDSRKPAVAFGDTIEEDLARRDFTVNAMAIDLSDDALVDPFGGRDDLRAGVLRTPLDPGISFSEDPLRMLRAARFMAGYGLNPVPELTAAVTELVDRIEIVSIERVRDELQKLLFLPDPTRGIGFLVETGLWERLFPEFGSDTAVRRGRRAAAVASVPAERWAAFVSIGGVHELRHLRLSNALIAEARWLLEIAGHLEDEVPSTDRDLRALGELVPAGSQLERAVDFSLAVRAADGEDIAALEELSSRVDDLRSREPDFDDPVLPLDGTQVMRILALDSGPAVGRAMERLRRHRLDHGPIDAEEATRILLSP